ncbi:hypothetical protein BH18CHL2_BH18CHL2_04560 [soil metagenome]
MLGTGLRLFEDPDVERIQLEKERVEEIGSRTSLSFRVLRMIASL